MSEAYVEAEAEVMNRLDETIRSCKALDRTREQTRAIIGLILTAAGVFGTPVWDDTMSMFDLMWPMENNEE